MKGEVFGIFPTPVLKFNLDRDFTKEELDFIYLFEGNIPPPPYYVHLGNNATSDKKILDHPEMANLKLVIDDCLNEWCKNVYAPSNPESFKLKITQSWINYTKPGEHHDRHYHPNSIVSGVLYIDTNPKKDQIIFNSGKMYDFYIPWKKLNQFNSMEAILSVNKKEIILFPSNLNHSVPKNEGTNTRISLAFNSFFEGTLGVHKTEPNYTEFNSVS
jgi:uncharacterized protein (TIGR02466 family)